MFETFAPSLYRYYSEKLAKVWDYDPSLRPGFDNSVWPCVAINFGTRVITQPHRDCMNLAYGWCAITALGNFDSTTGGHLVLPDLRIIIRFPSGSTIFIPSAILTHCNIDIAEGEERSSFTQFCAGDIFRFVDCGLQTEGQLRVTNPAMYEIHLSQKRDQWRRGFDLYPKGNVSPIC
jgi:hypothetical protein